MDALCLLFLNDLHNLQAPFLCKNPAGCESYVDCSARSREQPKQQFLSVAS